jgi:hypothetical protein
MKWKLLILIIMMLLIPIASAIEICEDRMDVGDTCIMMTPVLPCSGNYTIYNTTSYIRNGSMTLIKDSIYNFIFSEGIGDYLVKLCDNSTREIRVEGEDNMIFVAIMGMFMFFIALVIIALFKANKIWLKTCLSLGLSILIMSLIRFSSWFVSISYAEETELINTLDHFYMFGVWGFRIVLIASIFILLIIILNSFKRFGKKNKDNWHNWGAE